MTPTLSWIKIFILGFLLQLRLRKCGTLRKNLPLWFREPGFWFDLICHMIFLTMCTIFSTTNCEISEWSPSCSSFFRSSLIQTSQQIIKTTIIILQLLFVCRYTPLPPPCTVVFSPTPFDLLSLSPVK